MFKTVKIFNKYSQNYISGAMEHTPLKSYGISIKCLKKLCKYLFKRNICNIRSILLMSYKKFGNNISQEQIIAYIKATYIQQNFSSSAQQIGGTKHAV